jgi:hypothetical protein
MKLKMMKSHKKNKKKLDGVPSSERRSGIGLKERVLIFRKRGRALEMKK